MYNRTLGAAVDCLDPANVADANCGSDGSGSVDWGTLISQGLTDLTQLVSPGTPTATRTYTPTSTAFGSLFSNPLVLIGGIALVYALSRRR
jgi:hypothetical protein